MSIEYIKGDATSPQGEDNKMIIHCCNDIGGWGAGFVLALSKKWTEPEQRYRAWASGPMADRTINLTTDPFMLGFIQAVGVAPDIAVVNMIGQKGTGPDQNGFPPIRYWAIDECLKKVAELAKKHNASVHAPYLMGCALAGGEWDYIEHMLQKRLVDEGIQVTAYDFEGKRS